jgi:integrase
MASIYKRKDTEHKKGKPSWRAVIRIKGYPTVSKTSDRKQELIDWAQETERKIKSGQFNFDHYKNQHTFEELVDRYIQDGVLEHHRSADDTQRHLKYWKSRLGAYAIVHINAELLSKERQHLTETPTSKGSQRTTATTNRYMSSLSSLLSYAASHLNWLRENPALRLKKLKESRGRDRILSEDEITRLLSAAKESKSQKCVKIYRPQNPRGKRANVQEFNQTRTLIQRSYYS